jgi:ABC-type Fe3+/spermidine/putrescine transport system ATPase subunit
VQTAWLTGSRSIDKVARWETPRLCRCRSLVPRGDQGDASQGDVPPGRQVGWHTRKRDVLRLMTQEQASLQEQARRDPRPAAASVAAKDIVITGVRHDFGDFTALRDVSLEVAHGEFVTLLGPSGSGKTTLLRIVGGMVRPTKGRVSIGGRDVTYVDSSKRGIGFVFQNYALFPHLTVFENVAFPLKLRRVKAAEVRRRVADALRLVHMEGYEERHPAQLSGGQQQRVALARAIVFNPSVLLMDEPLGSLDKRLRQQLQLELRRLQQELDITTVYVTHDQDEAFAMSDRIAVMSNGVIHQIAPPADIYLSPANTFVANFVGDLNFFEGEVARGTGGHYTLRTQREVEIKIAGRPGGLNENRGGWGIRPERVQVGFELNTSNRYPAVVKTVTFQGSFYRLELELESGDQVVANLPEIEDIAEGIDLQAGWGIDDGRLFAETG